MKKIVYVLLVFTIMVTLLFGCSYRFNFDITSGRSIQSGESSMDGSGINEMEVNSGVGTIKITKSSGKDVKINYKKEVRGNSEDVQEVADKISVDSEISGDKLVVKVNTNDDNPNDFWNWLSTKYKNINVSVHLDIEVPDNIEAFTVNDGVGDILISDINGSFNVKSGVGKITIKKANMSGKSDITSGTGDIDLDCDISNAKSLSAQSGVGSINIRLPKDSKISLDAAAGVGNIKGNLIEPNKESFVGDNLKQDVNGGGVKMEVTTGTGSITINKK